MIGFHEHTTSFCIMLRLILYVNNCCSSGAPIYADLRLFLTPTVLPYPPTSYYWRHRAHIYTFVSFGHFHFLPHPRLTIAFTPTGWLHPAGRQLAAGSRTDGGAAAREGLSQPWSDACSAHRRAQRRHERGQPVAGQPGNQRQSPDTSACVCLRREGGCIVRFTTCLVRMSIGSCLTVCLLMLSLSAESSPKCRG